MHSMLRRVLQGSASGMALAFITGCASPKLADPTPRILLPPQGSVSATPAQVVKEAETGGQLVSFGKLRTVLLANEAIVDQSGKEQPAREILPALEGEFAKRDFRIFSGAIEPSTDIAAITRATRAHLIVMVDARSEFVNTSGKFSKYRAIGEARAVRGRDGTVLAVVRGEAMGPRQQEDDRAGMLALRELTPTLATPLVEELLRKSDQLLWAGLLINNVPTMNRALEIQQAIEAEGAVSYVELLEWNKETRVASYEITYGMAHESDVGLLLNRIPGMKIRAARYEPGQMDALRKILTNYK